ncbi:uncharacterized protein LOC141614258 [Silene latifolia]|uniref:uncharacterized protein LOC141614258 n=1 Tax=Silene latifolia TaxID=37657 RepID=UPI003D787DFE
MSVTEAAVSAVLVKEQEGVKHPVYYISKSLLPAETRYTSFEKLALALVTASYKLRPYFESHTIHWVRLTIRAQNSDKIPGLADFVSDFCPATRGEAEEGMLIIMGSQDSEIWTLYIDGASNARGASVSLVLRSPKGDMIVQAIRCEFKATNNEAEYEALILGMQMASGLKVPRDQNVEADALATLGATFQPTELSNIPITHVLTPAIQKEPDHIPVKVDVHM